MKSIYVTLLSKNGTYVAKTHMIGNTIYGTVSSIILCLKKTQFQMPVYVNLVILFISFSNVFVF